MQIAAIWLRGPIGEVHLDVLDLDRLRATPLRREPFDFVVVEGFVRGDAMPAILAGFPAIRGAGSYPVESLDCGPAFTGLVAALTGPALGLVVAEKFSVDLGGRPTMLTVRGNSDGKDGRVHTDSETKIITLLLYLNAVWKPAAGRLRLLRGPGDLEDFVCEVVPLAGTMVAFRRSGRSYHGHLPHIGPRRAMQLNWVVDADVLLREGRRHRWSARVKKLNPFRVVMPDPIG